MNLSTGIDIIEISRVASAIERHGERFLNRIYTAQEIKDCGGRVESLAARFSAKEATAKALGTGFGEIGWDEVEIRRGEKGVPKLFLYGKAKKIAEDKNLSQWSVSLSHSRENAIAMVVGTGEA